MRLFAAVELSDEMKEELFRVITLLKESGTEGNFTLKSNMHLTLAFIGETPRVAEAKSALKSVSAESFVLRLLLLGSFGDILWAGTEKQPALFALADGVRESLCRGGFQIDEKPFRPHITIARSAVLPRGAQTPSLAPVSMRVSKITLMRSERIGGRLTYTPIETKELF